MKLNDILTVRIGKNLSRNKGMEEGNLIPYSYEDLIQDLNQQNASYSQESNKIDEEQSNEDNYFINAGDVVFSFVSSTAGIVSKTTAGKVLNQNFAKLIVEESKVDGKYLCYCLNESTLFKRQMAVSKQGSILPKLTPSILKELDIPLPNLTKQQLIGKAYFSLLRKQFLQKEKSELEKKFILALLEQ